jgi:hypothetical protein
MKHIYVLYKNEHLCVFILLKKLKNFIFGD